MTNQEWNDRSPEDHRRLPEAAFGGFNGGDEGLDLAQIWSTLRGRRKVIFGFTFAVFGLSMALTFAARMDFKSSGRLYLGELDGKAGLGGNQGDELDLLGGKQ